MKQTFEEYLQDICPNHTNNGPEGFEIWLEQLDTEEIMNYAMDFGLNCFEEGKLTAYNK